MHFNTSRRSFLQAAGGAVGAAAIAGPDALASRQVANFGEDAALLARAYGALHPGLYRYNSPPQMDARFAALHNSLSAPRSLSDAYLAFARITAAVRCGHSYPNFYNQTDAITAALFDGRSRLPFLFRWIGDRMIVTRDLSGAGLEPGTEIHSIERIEAKRLLSSLIPFARADGHNDAKRRRILAVEGIDRFQAFDIYMPMLWPQLVSRGKIAVFATKPGGPPRRIELALMTPAERLAVVPPIDTKPKDAALWSLDRKPDGIACLTMPSWSVYNGSWDWRAWLEARLDEIATDGTRGLIIDLRGNEGGLDCGNPILARLVEREIAPVVNARRVRARRVPDDIRTHVDTWDKRFYDWGERATGPRSDGFYDLAASDSDANGGMTIRPAGKRFRGKVAVLTDASNSSATFGFAQVVKSGRLATLVGQTTGGNRRGINGGAFLFLRLPASGIEIDIPLIGYFPPGAQPDAGIVPDMVVEETPSDIAAGLDRTMSVAMRAVVGRDGS